MESDLCQNVYLSLEFSKTKVMDISKMKLKT